MLTRESGLINMHRPFALLILHEYLIFRDRVLYYTRNHPVVSFMTRHFLVYEIN